MNQIKLISTVLVVFLFFDSFYLWGFGAAKRVYIPMHKKIQKGKVTIRYIGAIVAYALLALGIYYFVLREGKEKNKQKVALNGALFGLVSYGIYNSTNYALLKRYGLSVAFQDTIWGIVVSSSVGVISLVTFNHFVNNL